MSYIAGVNMLPGTGEFTLDVLAHAGQRATESDSSLMNVYNQTSGIALLQPGSYTGQATDFEVSIANLLAEFPACETVALVVAWFFNSTSLVFSPPCAVYPSTTYLNQSGALPNSFWQWDGTDFSTPDHWIVSGLNETSSVVPPISSNGTNFNYGGTPSDQSVVRAIRYLKDQNCPATGNPLRVVFYPFLLGDIPGSFPWRGRITLDPTGAIADVSSAATTAVNAFLGSAVPGDFSISGGNVVYSGAANDFTFRRMILHYANLVTLAASGGVGVDLFLIGSELRGLETIRGPAWTEAGTTSGGTVYWDYPFVGNSVAGGGLYQLVADVRSIFNAAGLTKDTTNLHNLISYAADWSSWMGYQHTTSNPSNPGQWPHLDQLWASPDIDLVCFDNYMPMSDWTTGDGNYNPATGQSNNIDLAVNWSEPAFSGTWPPTSSQMSGLGLSGAPTLYSKPYLKANIEGGEKFNWFYNDGAALVSPNFDPLGSGLKVSMPAGDRRAQSRNAYSANQQLLANKQLRWWWNNLHYPIYPSTVGGAWIPQGGDPTRWTVNSKSIAFTEYGFPTCDKCTNQPNVFWDQKSSESATPYWSAWQSAFFQSMVPVADPILATLALQAVYEYWFTDTPSNNETVGGVVMVQQAFCSAWAWDARPFPWFPRLNQVWGDYGNWQTGNWIGGKGPFIPPLIPDTPPAPGMWPVFPTLAGQGWSIKYTPIFVTLKADHVSGRSSRGARVSTPILEIELTYDFLRMAGAVAEYETLVGFFASRQGPVEPFTFSVPTALGFGSSITCRFMDDQLDLEQFMLRLWGGESITIQQVKGE